MPFSKSVNGPKIPFVRYARPLQAGGLPHSSANRHSPRPRPPFHAYRQEGFRITRIETRTAEEMARSRKDRSGVGGAGGCC